MITARRATCFVCGQPARYLDAASAEPLCGVHSYWAEKQTLWNPRARHERRLIAFHGIDKAVLIIAGKDPESNADVCRWNAICQREAA
jgi:hypothetical protein